MLPCLFAKNTAPTVILGVVILCPFKNTEYNSLHRWDGVPKEYFVKGID